MNKPYRGDHQQPTLNPRTLTADAMQLSLEGALLLDLNFHLASSLQKQPTLNPRRLICCIMYYCQKRSEMHRFDNQNPRGETNQKCLDRMLTAASS